MNPSVVELVRALDAAGVPVATDMPAHLPDEPMVRTDLDLVVPDSDAADLMSILDKCGFIPTESKSGGLLRHYLGFDPHTGSLSHVRCIVAGHRPAGWSPTDPETRPRRGVLRHPAAARWTGAHRPLLTPPGGGAVIAFVGSEASGKSTLLADCAQWLGTYVPVRAVHAGKPPPTAPSRLPNLLLPVLRAAFPRQRSTRIDLRRAASPARGDSVRDPAPSLLFAVRAVLLAHDRHVLLTRAAASAATGTVVLCDRYPSATVGAPDSPQLPPTGRRTLRGWLARREAALYAAVPPPDLVVHARAPLDVVLRRNRERAKTEPEDLVRLRHRQTTTLRFDGAPTHVLDTARPLDECTRDVRALVWRTLSERADGQPDVGPLRPATDGREPEGT